MLPDGAVPLLAQEVCPKLAGGGSAGPLGICRITHVKFLHNTPFPLSLFHRCERLAPRSRGYVRACCRQAVCYMTASKRYGTTSTTAAHPTTVQLLVDLLPVQ